MWGATGLRTAHICDHRDIRQKVREVLDQPGPVVCAVNTAIDQATAPRATSMMRPDGSMVSKPMEDLWPFLDREEFRGNMIIPPVQE